MKNKTTDLDALDKARAEAAAKFALRGQNVRHNDGYFPQDAVFTEWLDDELESMKKSAKRIEANQAGANDDLEAARKRAAAKFAKLGEQKAGYRS